MATFVRQPFAPLDGARLQTLTSIKNRQNAATPQPTKRKASELADDDFENHDPALFAKRSKQLDSSSFPTKDLFKPAVPFFSLTSKPSTPRTPTPTTSTSPTRPLPSTAPRARTLLKPKSPISKLNTSARPSPLSAPAGRSPTRGRRSGILSRRRGPSGSYARVDPPHFNIGAAAPFSLDAALKGTIPSYAARTSTTTTTSTLSNPTSPLLSATENAITPATENDLFLSPPDMKASWFFDIHEDTPEQEMTNLLQHGTCVLDISSDEESERRASRERAEGRDKENIPPADDVSQTSRRAAAAAGRRFDGDEMQVEKERLALAEMDAKEFYPKGCDASSIVIVPGDEEDGDAVEAAIQAAVPESVPEPEVTPHVDVEPEVQTEVVPVEDSLVHIPQDVDTLMSTSIHEPCSKAAVLEPMEGTGESFDLWESSSAKDDAGACSVHQVVEA